MLHMLLLMRALREVVLASAITFSGLVGGSSTEHVFYRLWLLYAQQARRVVDIFYKMGVLLWVYRQPRLSMGLSGQGPI